MGKSVGPASGRLGVRIPAATDAKSQKKTGNDSSTAKCSAIGVSVTGAPTGAAAYNISGYTLHAAFLLPVNVNRFENYIPLSGDRLAALMETVGNIKVLIIDEIFMVGSYVTYSASQLV